MKKTIDQQRYVKCGGRIIIIAVAMILLPVIFYSTTLACIKVNEVSIYAGKSREEADEHKYEGKTMYIPIDSKAYFRAEIDDVCNPGWKDYEWQFDFDRDGIWDYNELGYWTICTPTDPPNPWAWTYDTAGWYYPKVKVGLEDVPDSDAEDTCRVAVVKVTNLVWQTYPGNTPISGGKIFPGKKTYDDTHGPDRRKVKVKATLNIAPDASDNIYVHFKRWDVDDPCFSTAPLDPDDSDPDPNKHSIDNRGYFKFENNDHSVDVLADGSVVYYATFLVSMNPGDNYRITATTSHEAKDDLTHYEVETGSIPSSVKRTPMLTTWRKLWIERDYMAPVPSTGNEKNRITGTADSYNYDTETGQTTVDLGQNMPVWFDDEDQFEGGRYIVGGNTYNVISYSDPIGDDEIVVEHNCSSEPKEYMLYDDDDQDLFDSPYYCSVLEAAFRDAYIEPCYLPSVSYSDEVNFNLNLTWSECVAGVDYDNEQDVWSSSDFWACLLVSCYQYKCSEDADPDGTGPGDPETDTHFTYGVTPSDSDNASAIFVETRKDKCTWSEEQVVSHEVGHTGGGDDHEGEWCLMYPFCYSGISSFCHDCLKIFRKKTTWLATD